MHEVAVVALHGVLPFDLAMPCEVFRRVFVAGIDTPYTVRVCGEAREIRTADYDLRVPFGLERIAGAQTVILPGIADPTMPIPGDVIDAVRKAAADGARVASICSGAFVLAATGLLDGLRATTHWLAAPVLAERYRAIEVDPDVLFVDNGQFLTSAGAAAGLDLCLHMVRRDYGAAAAANAARLAVMPLERDGGQAQFIVREAPLSNATLAPLLQWMERNLDRDLGLDVIARQARLSNRTLSRRFREQTGTTPLQWVLNARVRRAQELLESTDLSVEQVATQAGFDSAITFRGRFTRVVGVGPTAYRKTWGWLPNDRRLTRRLPPSSDAACDARASG